MRRTANRLALLAALCVSMSLLTACDAGGGAAGTSEACPGPGCPGCPGPACAPFEEGKADGPAALDIGVVNPTAGRLVLYEIQARSANACDPDVGADWQRAACAAKVAPAVEYRAEGVSCADGDDLARIRLGTLDDLVEDTADFRAGITVRYVDERVGANAIWLMPLFPNNDRWNLPHPCDNLGSPYAVRDYLHVRGSLSRACIERGVDEESDVPCFGDDALEDVVDAAHGRGMRVLLDVALNHFGHGYRMYDYVEYETPDVTIASNEDLEALWDFEATFDERLVHPEVLDRPSELEALVATDAEAAAALAAVRTACPDLDGQALVRAFTMWRNALDWERDAFRCDDLTLEARLPGFYLGANNWLPSQALGDNFTNDWRDVKFLYHQRTNAAHRHEYVRNREYVFRVLNYWVSKGVDGFRLDHATDYFSGMSGEEWRYVLGKVIWYAERRGQARPVFLAEEFMNPDEMAAVVDILTEGYVHDMTGRSVAQKDATHVEWVIDNMGRFGGQSHVMTALETHDEHRLTDGTGFDVWTGAGFWGLGAATWSTPMLLMGQEFGESWGLPFKRSAYLRARFEESGHLHPQADALVDYYGDLARARLAPENRALTSAPYRFLRTREGGTRDGLVVMARWSGDGNVVFAAHSLWPQFVAASYVIPADLAATLWIEPDRDYRLVDALPGGPQTVCRPGAELTKDLYIEMGPDVRAQWLRLEACP